LILPTATRWLEATRYKLFFLRNQNFKRNIVKKITDKPDKGQC